MGIKPLANGTPSGQPIPNLQNIKKFPSLPVNMFDSQNINDKPNYQMIY